MIDVESGFNHRYPARKCPDHAPDPEWEALVYSGRDAVWMNHPPVRNPHRHATTAWFGFEVGVYWAETHGKKTLTEVS